MSPLQITWLTKGPSSATADKRGCAFAEEGRSTCPFTQATHLFEAERHGEHADTHDAVHHVHDETRVGRRHCGAAEGKSSVSKRRQNQGVRQSWRAEQVSASQPWLSAARRGPTDSRGFFGLLRQPVTWRSVKTQTRELVGWNNTNTCLWYNINV